MTHNNYPNANTIYRSVLDNGITVMTYRNPNARTVVLDGGLWAGATNDAANGGGQASFVASMLMRGSQKRSFEQIYDDLEAVGASLSFSSGYHITEFSAESLAEDLDLLLDIVTDSLFNPVFPTDHIEKVRNEILTGIYLSQNNTRAMASRNFRKLIYGDHPYARATGGTLESVPAISRDDLQQFHTEQYGTNGMMIVMVSDMEPEAAANRIAAAFSGRTASSRIPIRSLPTVARPVETVRVHHNMPEKTQSDVVLGLPGPVRSVLDYDSVRIANHILGQFGMMGRIGKSVREEQGLAYYASSRMAGGIGQTPWSVSTGVAPDKVDQAIGAIRDEIRRIQDEPVSAEELADSQANLTGSLPLSIETSNGLADIIYNMEYLSLGLDYLNKYADNINAVTVEDVQAAAQKYFSADQIGISIAGSTGEA